MVRRKVEGKVSVLAASGRKVFEEGTFGGRGKDPLRFFGISDPFIRRIRVI